MADFVAACRAKDHSPRTIEFYLEGLNQYRAFAGGEDRDLTLGRSGVAGCARMARRLRRTGPRDSAVELSRAIYAKMIQNLVWATGYNLVAIPVAMGVLVPWGIDLPMSVGAIAQPGGSGEPQGCDARWQAARACDLSA